MPLFWGWDCTKNVMTSQGRGLENNSRPSPRWSRRALDLETRPLRVRAETLGENSCGQLEQLQRVSSFMKVPWIYGKGYFCGRLLSSSLLILLNPWVFLMGVFPHEFWVFWLKRIFSECWFFKPVVKVLDIFANHGILSTRKLASISLCQSFVPLHWGGNSMWTLD